MLKPGASLAEVLARPPLAEHEEAMNAVMMALKNFRTAMKPLAKLEHRTYHELLTESAEAIIGHLSNP
jgi:hypothetical protein